MDTQRLIERFRSEVHDTAQPPLWSDDEVVSYLNEAQRWLCRLDQGIADSTSELTRVPMVTNEPFGVIDERILKIRYAARASDSREISIANFEDIQTSPVASNRYCSALPSYLLFDNTQTGAVTHMVTGMEEDKVRWMLVPAADDTANLIVYRTPLCDITTDNLAPLEVHDKHHIPLLDGMKSIAYKKEDAECFDKGKQVEHENAFTAYCMQAKRERERREHKYRTVRYGGL